MASDNRDAIVFSDQSSEIRLTGSLLFRFTIIFFMFTLFILIVTGFTTYFSQMEIYKKQSERNISEIGDYLRSLIENDWADFKDYRDYYMAHFEEINIPYDFDDYSEAAAEFERLFTVTYPGKTFGIDVDFDEMTPELQEAYFIYRHEYWTLTFERARVSFGLPYTYFLVMKEDIHNVVYLIDGERTEKQVNGKSYIYLGDEYYNDPEVYSILWDTWEKAEPLDGYQEWNNAWGHTYAYYTPLVLNGEKLGIIGTEVAVADVNREILRNTIQLIAGIAFVLVSGMILILAIINTQFIRRTKLLELHVEKYSECKDEEIATEIERDFDGNDELSSLGIRFAEMIHELEDHMRSLSRVTQDLAVSQQLAAEMDEVANKDTLTGIRNRNAYSREAQVVEKERKAGMRDFGIAVVDINELKNINDHFGNNKGDESIRIICRLICQTFAHSAVFRTGGDEFVVIMKGDDHRVAESLISDFERSMKERAHDVTLEPWEKATASLGYAAYDPGVDENYMAVYRKAQDHMAERKLQMKALRKIRL